MTPHERAVTTHTHAALLTEGPYPFTGPVAGRYLPENPAAHGGTVFIEQCECGAERRVATNRIHEELGTGARGGRSGPPARSRSRRPASPASALPRLPSPSGSLNVEDVVHRGTG